MDKRNVKAQAAMEFMMLVGVLLFMFTIMLGIVASKTTDIHKKREFLLGDDVVVKIQKEVNLAARAIDGYSREFSIPSRLSNKDYNVTLAGNEVIVSTEMEDFWRIIPPVVGNITKGINRINKTNGIIYIN